jgi:hypothetical protein
MPRLILALLLLLAPPASTMTWAQESQPAREAVVANDTDRLMQEIYLYPVGATEPGRDRLANAVLPPRAMLRIPLPRGQACGYEVRVVFDDGADDRRRLDVCRTPRVAFADNGPRRDLAVVNDSDVELRELYLWPSTARAPDSGTDRLGTRTVPSGETLPLRLRGTADCVFDLRAVFADDTEEKRQRVDLCRTPRLAFGDPSLPVREAAVANRARFTVRELYARALGQDGWGADRLGSATLEPRADFALRIRSRDCRFDLRAVYENDREELQPGLDLCRAQAVELAGPGPALPGELRRLLLVNGYRRTIAQVFLIAPDPDDWGEDQLGDAVLPPGARQEISVTSGCTVDLRIVFDSDAAEERRGIDLCANSLVLLRPGWAVAERLDAEEPAAAPAPAPGGPALVGPVVGGVRLRNRSSLPIVELYVSRPGSVPGTDRLGSAVIAAGGVLDFAPPAELGQGADRCRADLTAVFRDGRALRLPGFDLCSGEEVPLQ